MTVSTSDQYTVYRTVIKHVLSDQEHLPSLPAITLKIRQAISNDNTTVDKLAALISKDPAFSALLMKSASSPLYKTVESPKTIQDVIALMGINAIDSLVMKHSIKSLFVMRSPELKKLFSHTWKRLAIKSSMANFLAIKLGYRPADEALMAALLTEVGALAVLSALQECTEIPTTKDYILLCKNYSKSLGSILLHKWNLDPVFIDVAKQCGQWQNSPPGELALIDVINLSLYNTIVHTPKASTLPDLDTIPAFQKLPATFKATVKPNVMRLITDNREEINHMIKSF